MKKILAALGCMLLFSGQVAPVPYAATPALAASQIVKATPGRLFGFTAFNNNAAVRYVLVYDSAAVPTDGATTPVTWVLLAGSGSPPNNAIFVSWDTPTLFSAGIVLVCSSTGPFTKTAATDCAFSAKFQ